MGHSLKSSIVILGIMSSFVGMAQQQFFIEPDIPGLPDLEPAMAIRPLPSKSRPGYARNSQRKQRKLVRQNPHLLRSRKYS